MSWPGRAPNTRSDFLFFFSLVLMTVVLFASCQPTMEDNGAVLAAEKEAIRELLMNQQDDWNDGDIEAFMGGYLNSDSLRFASEGSYRFGWKATLDRYHTSYPVRAAMGRLTFSDLAIELLSEHWAMAFGAWNLKRGGDYDDIGGLFTLILLRTSGCWRIKYDHTSRAS